MKYCICFILGLIVSINLLSQQCFSQLDTPLFNKNQICFYDSGFQKIKEVFFLIDEKKNIGKNVMWSENGSIKYIHSYRNGIAFGTWTNWLPIGKKSREVNYSYDSSYVSLPLKHTADTLFLGDSPFMILTYTYRNPRVGEYKEWHTNGNIWIEGQFKQYKCSKEKNDEVKIGIWKYYYDNGAIAMEKHYNDSGILIKTKIY